jgi:hypothetical protein
MRPLNVPEGTQIPYPPEHLFQREDVRTVAEQIVGENQPIPILDRFEFPESGGTLVYHVGSLHPTKGFPYPEAIGACNLVKRITINLVKSLSRRDILLAFGLFIFFPLKRKLKIVERFMNSVNEVNNLIMIPHYLKEKNLTPCAKEIWNITVKFLDHLNFKKQSSNKIAQILAHLIEYDTAYRYRIQDIMTECNQQDLIGNPLKEIIRLLEILRSREPKSHIFNKFKNVVQLLRLAFFSKTIKKAFINAIKESNIDNLRMDEADRYHCLKFSGYDFFGRTYEDRFEEYTKLHNGNMPLMARLFK